jgi:hypothetical protein
MLPKSGNVFVVFVCSAQKSTIRWPVIRCADENRFVVIPHIAVWNDRAVTGGAAAVNLWLCATSAVWWKFCFPPLLFWNYASASMSFGLENFT